MLAYMAAGFSAIEVEEAVSGSLVRGEGEMKASGVSTDSRSLQTGELFVPISGPNFDGHDFIKTAFESGAAGCLAGRGR